LTVYGDHRRQVTPPTDVVSVLVALEFVVMAALLLLLVPLDVAAPLLPLALVFVLALLAYRS
jgi:hypothetical protein